MRFKRKQLLNLSDERLMALVQAGKHAAFEVIYDRYSRRLLHFFHRMLGGNEAKAQDFLQELFMRVIDRRDQFQCDRRFRSWLYAIAHNLCKNEYRRLAVRQAAEDEAEAFAHNAELCEQRGPYDDVVSQEFVESVFRELQQLDEEKRSTFLLRHQQGLSINEISETLDCPAGTVKSRLFYTSQALAEKLREFNPNEL